MDTSNIIALALGATGFIVSIVGLMLTPILNLKSKRLEKRLAYRFQLFQKILELWEHSHSVKEPDMNPLLLEINKLIQLHGYSSEIILFKELVDFYNYYIQNQNEVNRQQLAKKFNGFFTVSFNAYRKEIALDKLAEI